MTDLYDQDDAPAVRYYDLYTQGQNVDIDFWIEEARRADGPVLELTCGGEGCFSRMENGDRLITLCPNCQGLGEVRL